MTAGMQLGDAKRTFNNLKELAYDVENWYRQIEEGFGRGGGPEPLPPPDDEEKSIQPGEEEPEQKPDSEIDGALKELDEMLSGYGTTLDEVLSVIGTEVVFCFTPDAERANARAQGEFDISDVFETGTLGIAVGLKDVEKARKLLANARENDPKGAFRGFEEIDIQGGKATVSSEHPFGWAFTENALLLCVVLELESMDAAPAVTAALSAMLAAPRSTGGPDRSFTRNSSKFLDIDFAAVARMETDISRTQSEKLDRYARPPLRTSPTSLMQELTFALRSREAKDGIEVALRVNGLPDVWQFITGEASMFGGGEGGTRRNAYSYGESNLRMLADALRKRAEADKPVDLDEMVKAGELRAGVLQLALDKRWKGDLAALKWITLDQIVRDAEGNLQEWVDKKAAEMIEANEKAGFRSIKLAQGEIGAWIKDYKAGFIVAYQEAPDSLGGHVIVYADGQVGWLSAGVFKEALKLNSEGKPVPGDDPWGAKPEREGEPEPPGERLPKDDPWLPEKK
jgi:hypothetical protein